MRVFFGGAAVLLAVLVSGCSDDPDPAPARTPATGATGAAEPAAAAGPPWFDDVKAAPAGGPAGACKLPVTFEIAADWKIKPVELDDSELAQALGTKSGATMACEIDAKPAGHLGFLRVWTLDKGTVDARAAIESFAAADRKATDKTFRDLKAGGMPASEVTYLTPSQLDEGQKDRERALAVAAPKGTIVLVLDSLDADEFEGMLPAFRLARDSMAEA